MDGRLEVCIGRVLNTDGQVAGTTFLISERHLLTCAHVVAQALGIDHTCDESQVKGRQLGIDIHTNTAHRQSRAAQVIAWLPVAGRGAEHSAEDIAVLELLGEPSRLARQIHLSAHQPGMAIKVYGFGQRQERVRGSIAGNGQRWTEIDCERRDVLRGYSGAPVFDAQHTRIVGMVVAREDGSSKAFMIGSHILQQVLSAAIPSHPRLDSAFAMESGGPSRLQKQLARSLDKILAETQLASHRFFQKWREIRPQVSQAQLYRYCVEQAKPFRIIADVAGAVRATWPQMKKVPSKALSMADATDADAVLIDLCCQMSLVAFERQIHSDPAGSAQFDNGVFNVGMFAREAAAIAAAVWMNSGLKLKGGRAEGAPLKVVNLIEGCAESQLGCRTQLQNIEAEIAHVARKFMYQPTQAHTRLPAQAATLHPDHVREGLDDMEAAWGVRPLVAIDGEQEHTYADEMMRRQLMERWDVDVFFYARPRADLSEPLQQNWQALEASMLEHFTTILNAGVNMPDAHDETPLRVKAFISYAHVDDKYRLYLAEQLGVLASQGLVELWDDKQIGAGEDWYRAIDQRLLSCQVAVLLVSPAFLTSRFILGEEVPRLLARHQQGGMMLMPVLVRDCPWSEVAWLARLQMRPGGKPLDAKKNKRETQLKDIALEIARFCKTQSP